MLCVKEAEVKLSIPDSDSVSRSVKVVVETAVVVVNNGCLAVGCSRNV